MLGAMEQLIRLHPASHFSSWERGHVNLEVFEELERRHVPPEPECEIERRESTWMLGEVAAATAMLVVFIGVLTAIARWSGEAPNAEQSPAIAVPDAAEAH